MEKTDDIASRKRRLAALARTDRDALEGALRRITPVPRYDVVKPAETGLVMVRGRAGGTGAPFNLGEMTVTRCVVRGEDGALGVGYVAGRDRRKAELVAVFDALLQDPARAQALEDDVIAPAEQRRQVQRARTLARAAATRVDFFTVVRGE
ncbi:phosphonate C-P lyase system protein PhnG [Vineibacter terrae]|uniref:Phosphonate C-P lyase system protein PhnG n=1 Tax=Vineibacter terrae TaxID=2586908 RepID=A0A5C8PSS8_9HYPH|nr:phosphonate C-P lyase system protein PhnG [Vineibacter terrae]TXL79539.1 phosphonate C-P lyase system protein PhnG [Vineibacter terrae]